MRALLVFEDGFHLTGEAFVGEGETYAEVVVNTSLSGYQEVLTDPSNHGQAVVFTYPQIGNYGVNHQDVESAHIAPRAIIVREYTPQPSNYRATMSLAEWLKGSGALGIHQIDTRAVVQHLRKHGSLKAAITTEDADIPSLARKAAESPGIVGQGFARLVSAKEPYTYAEGDKYDVAVLDCGVKRSLLDQFAQLGCTVRVLPITTSAEQVIASRPDALVISSGPGDPRALPEVVEHVRELMGRLPLLGVGLGHAIIGLALGLEVYKLKAGHHGTGHPAKELATGAVHLTSHNHDFAVAAPQGDKFTVEAPNGPAKALVTYRSLFDGTIEGLAVPDLKVYTFQFHPEGRPGPQHTPHFVRFLERIGEDA